MAGDAIADADILMFATRKSSVSSHWTHRQNLISLLTSTGPFHDVHMLAISCFIVPEEYKLFFTGGTFILKVFLCTGNKRGDTFSTCDLFEMLVKSSSLVALSKRSEEHLLAS